MNAEAGAAASPRPPFGDRLAEAALALVLGASIRVCEILGIERSLRGGAALGKVWRALGGPRTRRVREQLAAAYPETEANASQREAWHAEVFAHLGLGIAELLILLGRHRRTLLDRMRVEGLEHLERARVEAGGRGAIVIGPHLGNWELAAARFGSLGVPIAVVHRVRGQRVLDRALERVRNDRDGAGEGARSEVPVQSIAMGPRAGVQFVRALGAGRTVLVLLDQRAHRAEGLTVTFFGRDAETRSGPLKLADRLSVPVLIACARRDPDARGHRLSISPPLQLEPGAADDEEVLRRNLERVTAALESEIRASPGQWIWTHRRWRDQPDTERAG